MAEFGSQPKLSPAARRDVRAILLWSVRNFGLNAADRYRKLLDQAVLDIAADPARPGSNPRPELGKSARTYHLALSRHAVETDKVKTPRHLIFYRTFPQLEIVRILHENRDLPSHRVHD